MANMASSGIGKKIDGSSIIDMEVMGEDDSDYETSISGNMTRNDNDDDVYDRQRTQESKPMMEDMQKKVTQNVASYVWKSGQEQAKTILNSYANVDLLRPFFNVEPHEVRARLLQSLMPQKPGSQQHKVPRELYGPTMLVFTLIALLLFQMKTAEHTVQEGTLMGTAVGTCFGYWLGVSGFMWFLAYVCNSHITMLQLLCLLGYALFGHCVVMGLTTMFHTSHDHMFFYLVWAVFGGLSTLRMVSVLMSRTAGQTQRLIICGVISVLHLCFLLYLHFAYHKMVEDLSDMMQHAGMAQQPVMVEGVHKVAERSAQAGRPLPDNLPTKPPLLVEGQPKIAADIKPTAPKSLVTASNPVVKVDILKNEGAGAKVESNKDGKVTPAKMLDGQPDVVQKLQHIARKKRENGEQNAKEPQKGVLLQAFENRKKYSVN